MFMSVLANTLRFICLKSFKKSSGKSTTAGLARFFFKPIKNIGLSSSRFFCLARIISFYFALVYHSFTTTAHCCLIKGYNASIGFSYSKIIIFPRLIRFLSVSRPQPRHICISLLTPTPQTKQGSGIMLPFLTLNL